MNRSRIGQLNAVNDMANRPTLVLYDIETKKGTFSPYVFQVRMALNYKKIDFKTVWMPMSGIRETYEKVGIPPTPHHTDNPFYSVPALLDTSVTPPLPIAESINIIKYLDEKYPSNPLWSVRPPDVDAEHAAIKLVFLGELAQYFQGVKDARYRHISRLVIPHIPDILQDVDLPYFRESRSRWYKMPFDEIAPQNKEEVLNGVKDVFNKLAEFVDGYREKPFDPSDSNDLPWALGDTVSWADFALTGLFKWVEVSSPEIWDEIKTWNNGRWLRLVADTAQWR